MAGIRGGMLMPTQTNPYNPYNPNPQPKKPSLNNAYDSSLIQAGQDYDSLMSGYDALKASHPILGSYNYQETPEQARIKSNLSTALDTGGYSDSDVSNLRARAVSPIRAAYANAMRESKRAVNLSGGYSPNAGAVQAKLAREQSEVMSDASTNVNAALADRIASGKMQAASLLAPIAGEESRYRMDLDRDNLNETRRVADSNIQLELAKLAGKQNTYGMTPGLLALFGQQLLQMRGQDINRDAQQISINQGRASNGLNLIAQAAAKKSSGGMRVGG
jgi:hypothetical protein